MKYFQTIFLGNVDHFLSGLDTKTVRKVFYNIDLAEQTNDPKLFKKLESDIWEFRTKYNTLHIRLLAFWDKNEKEKTLVVVAHGFIKKTNKVPKNEIEKAIQIRTMYLQDKKDI